MSIQQRVQPVSTEDQMASDVKVSRDGQKGDDSASLVYNIIDGQPVVLPSSANFPVVSARTDEVVHYGQTVTAALAARAVDVAATTFRSYRGTPVHERRRMLLCAAELFEQKADAMGVIQMQETSCDEAWARFTAMQTSTFCREVAGAVSAAVVGDIQPSYFGYTHLVFKEPVGPILLIPPWNAAVVLCVRGIANALAAGCTVVLKASELCPATHQLVARTFHEAGFPPGAVNVIMADRPAAAVVTETVIAHPALRKVEFIGSSAVGKMIGMLAARYLKPVFMELGDQSPAIVLDDADLEQAARLVAHGATFHHGQVCFSTERIIVQKAVRQEFCSLLAAAIDRLAPKWMAVTKGHAERAKAVVDDAVTRGAHFVYGSSELGGPAMLAPSILVDVDPSSLMSNGEAFAPTAFLVEVDTEEEAVEEANSRVGGLSAAVFTRSQERGLRLARELEFGMVQVNNSTIFAEPSGAATNFKGSGWGSNNGKYGIENFLYCKSVSLVPCENKKPTNS
ncbi:Aldehyde/histidinol dehydrogenase [Chaetomium fimeti]|uniref:Aldehyde/histidinol dehydrogenase n=1 Tax=Chaetomium fimeti TaxID=1854472 RepID=A0AAE0H9Z6_9PEZI|nr:Aldehyde/histidinol dehydrogenase [Chaetomium fimeti]